MELFSKIKLFFTDRDYYKQRKRYIKRQKAVRKILRKKVNKFCPWSGYYIHDMIVTMLEFYHKTYIAKDCCWSIPERLDKIASSLEEVLHYAEELDRIDDIECEELIKIAEAESTFTDYLFDFTKRTETEVTDKNLGYLAYDFLEKFYTKKMYSLIGEHIWEWCD